MTGNDKSNVGMRLKRFDKERIGFFADAAEKFDAKGNFYFNGKKEKLSTKLSVKVCSEEANNKQEKLCF
jgi:hypothetical protein